MRTLLLFFLLLGAFTLSRAQTCSTVAYEQCIAPSGCLWSDVRGVCEVDCPDGQVSPDTPANCAPCVAPYDYNANDGGTCQACLSSTAYGSSCTACPASGAGTPYHTCDTGYSGTGPVANPWTGPPLAGHTSTYQFTNHPISFAATDSIGGRSVHMVGTFFRFATFGNITSFSINTSPGQIVGVSLYRVTPHPNAASFPNELVFYPMDAPALVTEFGNAGGWFTRAAIRVAVDPRERYALRIEKGAPGNILMLPSLNYGCTSGEVQPDTSGYIYNLTGFMMTPVTGNDVYAIERNLWLDVSFTADAATPTTALPGCAPAGPVFTGPPVTGVTSTYNKLGAPAGFESSNTIAGRVIYAVGTTFRVAAAGNITAMAVYAHHDQYYTLQLAKVTNYPAENATFSVLNTFVILPPDSATQGRWISSHDVTLADSIGDASEVMEIPVVPGEVYAIWYLTSGPDGIIQMPTKPYCSSQESQPDQSKYLYDLRGFVRSNTSPRKLYTVSRNFWLDVRFDATSDTAPTTALAGCSSASSSSSTGATQSSSSSTGGVSSTSSAQSSSSSTGGASSSSAGASSSTQSSSTAGGVEAWTPPGEYPVPVAEAFSTLVRLALNYDDIVDMDAFKQKFVLEMDRVIGAPEGTHSVANITSVTAGSVLVNITLDRTAAQILQQFSAAYIDGLVTVSATTYPIFVHIANPVIALPVEQAPPADTVSLPVYTPTSECSESCSAGTCYAGLCGCVAGSNGLCTTFPSGVFLQPGLQCVAGGAYGYADVCVSANTSTTDHAYVTSTVHRNGSTLVVTDECTHRYPLYYNLFPRRRWCQHRNYPYGLDASTYVGVLGSTLGAFNSTFRLQFPIPFTVLRSTAFRAEAVELWDGLFLVPNTTNRQYGYVSNLYQGATTQSDQNKVWSFVGADAEVAERTLHLNVLTFQDGVEGAADNYWLNSRWNQFNCSVVGWTGAAYVYWDGTAPACDCMTYHQREPLTGECVPGCLPGYQGMDCSVVSVVDSNCVYAINELVAFQRPSCEPVCHANATLTNGGTCVFQEVAVAAASSGSTEKRKLVMGLVIGAAALVITASIALMVFLWNPSMLKWRPKWWSRSNRITPARSFAPLVPRVAGKAHLHYSNPEDDY